MLIPRLIASAATASGNTSESVVETKSAIAFIPARGAFVLGVDQQRDAADILRDADAVIGRAQQESASESAALRRSVDGEAAETEHRHVVTRQAFLRERRRPRIVERRRAQRVEAENARRQRTLVP